MAGTEEPVTLSLPRALVLGLAAGVMSGLFGVGGGVVLVPGLVLLAAMPQHAAHATSLAAIIITAPAALVPFAMEGAVSWPAAAALALGSLAGAVGGADVMKRIPAEGLRRLFGVFLVVVAFRLFIPVGDAPVADAGAALGIGTILGLAVAGLATGLLSGLMGVGGGIVMVPVMVVGFSFSQHLAEGTSLAVIIPTAIVGAWRHSRSGYTRWRIGLTVGAGGVVGGVGGAVLAQRLDGRALQVAFGVLLLLTGARLTLRSRPGATPPERGEPATPSE